MNDALRLLIGYDGSQCAMEAIQDLGRAGLHTDHVNARVMCIADVWQIPPTDYPRLYPREADNIRRQIAETLEQSMALAQAGKELVQRQFPNWKVEARSIADSPFWGLVKEADDWPADLLVVGSHGRSAIGRMVFGSVSHNAVLYAHCSARVGRQPDPQKPAGAPVRVILAWDGSPDAREAVRAVARRPWPGGVEVRVVTALDARLATLSIAPDEPEVIGGADQAVIQDVREHLRQRAEAAVSDLRSIGLTVAEPVIQPGDPKRVLLDEAAAWQADCIFVGARGLSRMERVLLGSVSSAVAARAACSVEVVRSHPPV